MGAEEAARVLHLEVSLHHRLEQVAGNAESHDGHSERHSSRSSTIATASARRISPATSVGRLVGVAKQVPVKCGEVMVHPGDYIVGDSDGVVVVPHAAAERVVELLRQYDDKESRMIPIIQREKSMLKALEIYNRY